MKSAVDKQATPLRSKRILLGQFWKHAAGSRHLLLLIISAMLADGLMQAGVVNYLKILIDRLMADPSAFVRQTLPPMAVTGLVAGLLFFPVAYVGHLAFSVLGSRLATTFRMALYRHLQCLSVGFFNRKQSGEIASRLTQDVDNGVQIMVGFITGAAWATGVLLTALVSMIALSWKLTLIFIGLNVVYFTIWNRFRHRIGKTAREVRDQAGEVTACATEDIAAVMVMKTFAREDRFYNRFGTAQDRLYKAQVQAARITHVFGDVLQVIGKFIAPVIILGTGALLVDRDGLSIGSLVAFWSYWGLVQGPLGTLYGAAPGLASCMASMNRITDFFEEMPRPADAPGAIRFHPSEGKLNFQEVEFTYPGDNNRPIFNNLTFEVPARSSLGVVGPSGAGKSTLVQLVLRFYDPQKGCIRMDGMDLREMTQESLRKATGVVLQESLMLSGTLRDNLLLGDERATDAQLWTALEQAGAYDFVRATPEGLDTRVGERGVTLSGGQRQRLCIARVFVKNPPIVIFDEATSALDGTTEALIQDSMQRLLKGRTSMIIAHRLSTIIDCDNILMLKDGKVLGLAPHASLMKTCPEYAELVSKQHLHRAEE
ncbi:MAG TPA: hypothetical protein DCS43_05800 [Verrucomicrobia bacterium]|nr:hypothetical protein [Verrucomicrobiota bacterium]